jgi:hypothetical protein
LRQGVEIARLARDMHGGNGISDETAMRVLCNLEPSTPTRARTTFMR